MRAMLKGIAANGGLVFGQAYCLTMPDLRVTQRSITNVDSELNRFHRALAATISEVETIKMRVTKNLGADRARVFCIQISMLQAPQLIQAMERIITQQHLNAEVAVQRVVAANQEADAQLADNPYIQQRMSALTTATNRLVAQLLQVTLPNLALVAHPVVVITQDLLTSEMVAVNPGNVVGIVTDSGGKTAHAAILARSLGIPAVVGTATATASIKDDQPLIVNGNLGEVIVDPTATEIKTTKVTMAQQAANRQQLARQQSHKTETKDGVGVTLAANIGTSNDVQTVLTSGAEGIGLVRTEFLYMDADHLPSEDEQVTIYRQILRAVAPRPVVIRTLDIGADKGLPYLKVKPEANPFMGARAIRQSLAHQAIFRSQLRALIRASVEGNLRIMFPMIATLDELRQAKAIYHDERAQLTAKRVPMGSVRIGMMIEVPAAALLADRFAAEVDFMSVGTNDLIGYTLAADRTNQDVAYLYQPYHPAILRLINQIITAGHAAGIPVAMCGEMAGDRIGVPLLLGMGLDEFSMVPSAIRSIQRLIEGLSAHDLQALVETALNSAGTSQEVVTMVQAALPHILN